MGSDGETGLNIKLVDRDSVVHKLNCYRGLIDQFDSFRYLSTEARSTNRESVSARRTAPAGPHRRFLRTGLDNRGAASRTGGGDYGAFVRGVGWYDPDSPDPGNGLGRHPS